MRWVSKILPLLILLGSVLLYWQVQTFHYVWDDTALFVDDPALRESVDISAMMRRILPGISYFRPAVLASFALEFYWFGLDSAISHLGNLLIHLLNISLVGCIAFLLARDHFASPWVRASIAMLIYAFHPVLTEPVAWVAGRFDLLVTFFCLVGLIVLLTPVKRWIRTSLCGLAFLAAALSKEMAVIFPLLIFIFLWIKVAPEKSLRQYLAIFLKREYVLVIFIFLIGMFYLYLRHHFQGGGQIGDESVAGEGIKYRLALIGNTFLFYIKLTVWPYSSLGALHPFDVRGLSSFELLVGGVLAMLYACLVCFALWRRGCFWLLMCAYLLSLLPVLNVIPLSIAGSVGHARFMVLPIALAVLAISQANISMQAMSLAMRKALPIFSAMLLCFWLLFSILNIKITLPLWSNGMTLWGWMYKDHPDYWLARYNYLSALMMYKDMDKLGEVFADLKESKGEIGGEDSIVYADYLRGQGHYEESMDALFKYISTVRAPHRELLAKGISLDGAKLLADDFPRASHLRYAFGIYSADYLALGMYEKALDSAETMRFYNGNDYGPTYVAYGQAYYAMGRFDEGDKAFQRAEEIYPREGRKVVRAWQERFLKERCEKNPAIQKAERCKTVLDR
jgi:tetratricopeptide (TPR) repeat protein